MRRSVLLQMLFSVFAYGPEFWPDGQALAMGPEMWPDGHKMSFV